MGNIGKIIILDENTANKIAAGEVVERPASVVKELVENSIDAGAGQISVEIRNGGISFLKVTDNGSGMEEDDVEIAFERHSTSKIRRPDDLYAISSLGFRGEALASIAAVSRVELTTRTASKPYGMAISIHGGIIDEVRQTGCPVGTTLIIRDLFYNTPARFKFLKKDTTEAGYISEIMSRIALGNPHISFRLTSGGSTILHTPGNNDLKSAIFSIYGKETAREIFEVDYSDHGIKIYGYAGKPEIARSNRNQQSIYINGRYVKSKIITSAIDEAYKTSLMKNRYPFVVLHMEIHPVRVDVNVHPTKMEVRFSEEQEIFRSVFHAVSNALLKHGSARSVELSDRENPFRMDTGAPEKKPVIQEKLNLDFKEQKREEPATEAPSRRPESPRFDPVQCKPPGKYAAGSTEPDTTPLMVRENPPPVKQPQEPVEKAAWVNTEEKQEKQPENRDFLENTRFIGQAFSTYVILQNDREMFFVDQHAAHERIMFERLKKRFEGGETLTQMLLAPVVVELSNAEISFMESEKDFFNRIGFIYEGFGNNSVVIRSAPYSAEGIPVRETFLEVVDRMMGKIKNGFEAKEEEALYTIACKAAVKANLKLDEMEISEMLKELAGMDNPYTCPHGRPTVIRISKYELERKFKRIV